ncbi:TRAP-type C4-dicarboxylate transport system permease small subunit [Stella humosa]|uniref:TRAP transporter small permease protein n=1 Tax=Stella humosa TaxID=94 RepID=A0A3N1LXR9_9PROT|nr:TRAP transporter small permease [Stella humosa]ROP99993.1 TRAP-type C4-dicarboxylate transport system permease small subunit [Stella humosa]BBK30775.1 C4-dicarboxylate ABC transporter [Stella humosa]
MTAIHGLLEALSRTAGRATIFLVIAMTVVMTVCLILQVLFRYALGQALSWSEELALLMFTWTVLLAGSLGVREGFHVALTLLPDRLGPGGQRWLERLILVLVTVFGFYLAVSGWEFYDGTTGQLSAAVGYPIELLHSAALVSGALVVLHGLTRLVASFVLPPAPEARP